MDNSYGGSIYIFQILIGEDMRKIENYMYIFTFIFFIYLPFLLINHDANAVSVQEISGKAKVDFGRGN